MQESQKVTVAITTEYIELNKLLKFENLVESGGHAKLVIADGLVKVNGSVETQIRKKVRPGDSVDFADQHLSIVAE